MGKIFYVMGKSACGKDKIISRLMSDEELALKKLILYTTRPIRMNEENGKQYFFADEKVLEEFEKAGRLIESRSYHTVHGIWIYCTIDDGQIDLQKNDYLGIGTLESYVKMKKYFGEDKVVPLYIEVETGERLERALRREKKQDIPKYAEMCRRFLADEADFSEEKIQKAGIRKRFENVVLDDCIDEIVAYIKSVMADKVF